MKPEKNMVNLDVLGVKVSAINLSDACFLIENAVAQNKKIYICTCPVSTIMECRKNETVLRSVNSATLATPDGMPVVWLGKIKGYNNIGRVYGPDLLLEICRISGKKNYNNYFYGSSSRVLEMLQKKLKNKFLDLPISGAYSPPFRELTKNEDDEIVKMINNSNSDILWVGLGSPKQDIWMMEHRDKINVPVMAGVGAAFDFISEEKKQAPKWMRKTGTEWLFRLLSEPKRLWKRYLLGNPLFLYLVCKEFLTAGLPKKEELTHER